MIPEIQIFATLLVTVQNVFLKPRTRVLSTNFEVLFVALSAVLGPQNLDDSEITTVISRHTRLASYAQTVSLALKQQNLTSDRKVIVVECGERLL